MNINIRNVDWFNIGRATARVSLFCDEFPDRVGDRHGVTYGREPEDQMHVYRTKTGTIVVRGLKDGKF